MSRKPNVYILYWHNQPRSFNHALFTAARVALLDAGYGVRTSDLQAMSFNSVSDCRG